MDLSLFVKPGQRITAALWNKMAAAARSCRILAGDGVRLRQTPDGTLISCSAWTPWNHPFKVSLSGTSATIGRGLVDGIEPKIKDIPIGGDEAEGKGQPKLEIRQPKFDDEGRGWIAVEVTCDGEKWEVTDATIVQVADIKSADPLKGLHPLAMLRDAGNGTMTLFQIEYFNLQHRADVRESGKGARHFFWPA